MSTTAQILKDTRSGMEKAVENSKREFSGIRSGKASPNMLDVVKVEAYGSMLPLNQVASVSAPEPRILLVTPFDKGMAKVIEKAIRESELGLDPAKPLPPRPARSPRSWGWIPRTRAGSSACRCRP